MSQFSPFQTEVHSDNAISESVISESDRTPAIIEHVSPLAGFLLPSIGNLLGPLLAWLIYRDRSPMLNQQGKESLNFQISVWLYGLVLSTLAFILFSLGLVGGAAGIALGSPVGGSVAFMGTFIAFFIFALPLIVIFSIIPLIFMFLAVSSVSKGKPYHYPFTIRLIK